VPFSSALKIPGMPAAPTTTVYEVPGVTEILFL
jgi:hypothetical protein